MPNNTLGGARAHVYVTRAATLAYGDCEAGAGRGARPFEEARRVLTQHLLRAEPVPGDPRRWTFRTRSGEYVAYVVPDGDLLVVGSVSLAQGAPGAYSTTPPDSGPSVYCSRSSPTRKCRCRECNQVFYGKPVTWNGWGEFCTRACRAAYIEREENG